MIPSSQFDLRWLNHFKALFHLEIDRMPRMKGQLDLQELRIVECRAYLGLAKYIS